MGSAPTHTFTLTPYHPHYIYKMSSSISTFDYDLVFELAFIQAPVFAVAPPPPPPLSAASNDLDHFPVDDIAAVLRTPTFNTDGVSLAQISPSKAAQQQLAWIDDINCDFNAASPSLGRARAPIDSAAVLPCQAHVLPPPANTAHSGPIRARAPRTPAQPRTVGHPYARRSPADTPQPEVAAVVEPGLAIVGEPAIEREGASSPRKKLRRCKSSLRTCFQNAFMLIIHIYRRPALWHG